MPKSLLQRAFVREMHEMREFVQEIGEWTSEGLQRLAGSEQKALVAHFYAWAEAHLDSPTLTPWLAELDTESRTILATELGHFCHDLGLELSWLVEGQLAKEDPLYAALREIVEHYCQACRIATAHYELAQRFDPSKAPTDAPPPEGSDE